MINGKDIGGSQVSRWWLIWNSLVHILHILIWRILHLRSQVTDKEFYYFYVWSEDDYGQTDWSTLIQSVWWSLVTWDIELTWWFILDNSEFGYHICYWCCELYCIEILSFKRHSNGNITTTWHCFKFVRRKINRE